MNSLFSSSIHGNSTASADQSSHKVTNAVKGWGTIPAPSSPLFENPFTLEDLLIFDDTTLSRLLETNESNLTVAQLAQALHGAPYLLIKHIERNLPVQHCSYFREELHRPASEEMIEAARRTLLDELFWELTYWKTPELYDELTAGEQLHPGIFQQLEPDLCGKVVLDAGAGSGRASFECIRSGAKLVYAVEPSPGLLRILKRKVQQRGMIGKVVPRRGCFDKLPLEENSVDTTISCSAFTAEAKQGGEAGLAELHRVTKPGGKIVVIWPRTRDYEWLAEHGFHYVALPMDCELGVRFRSLDSASRCARHFYARNPNIVRYIVERRQSEVPYSILGFNPPCDYCWLVVE